MRQRYVTAHISFPSNSFISVLHLHIVLFYTSSFLYPITSPRHQMKLLLRQTRTRNDHHRQQALRLMDQIRMRLDLARIFSRMIPDSFKTITILDQQWLITGSLSKKSLLKLMENIWELSTIVLMTIKTSSGLWNQWQIWLLVDHFRKMV